MKTKIISGILIPTIAIIMYLLGNSWVEVIPLDFVENEKINHLIKFQSFGLILSFITLSLTLHIAPKSKKFLKFGNLSELSQPVKILGINANDSWYKTGLSFLVVITASTALFMYLSLGKSASWDGLIPLLPYVLIFSLTNSFNEEIITRFAVVGLLDGYLKPLKIMWSAALIFGLIHYFGQPGGPIGVLMAGFLGWLMAKSIIETEGIGVAWVVHFFQDVVIYSFLLISIWK